MKANVKAIRTADEGASVIVGAVLLFALTFLVMVMIQTTFVPVWAQNSEATNSEIVRSQLAYLKAQMERQVEGSITGALSSPVTLQNEGIGTVFGNNNVPPGILQMEETGGAHFELTSPEFSVSEVRDTGLLGAGETWTQFSGTGTTISDVTRMESLRARFLADTTNYKNEVATITVTDADGAYAGRFEMHVLEFLTNGNGIQKVEFWIQTFNSNNDKVWANSYNAYEDKAPAGEEPDYAWVDAMDSAYRFDRVLGAASTPYSLALTTTGGMPAEMSSAHFQATPGGDVLVGGGTEIITDYSLEASGARLRYQSLAQHFVQQDMVLEYGAILVTDGTAGSIIVAPSLAVGNTGSLTAMRWIVPNLLAADGSGNAQTNVVVTQAISPETVTGVGPEATVEIATQYGAAWAIYWQGAFERVGLNQGTDYTISSNSTHASFTLNGPTSGAAYDVAVTIQTARIEVLL